MKIVKLLFKILEVVDFVQLRVPDDNEYLLLEYLRLLCKKQGQIDDWLLE